MQDFGLTIFWAVMWFIASVAWAAESNQLQDDLEDLATCKGATRTGGATVAGSTYDTDYQTFVQANISIVSKNNVSMYCFLIINFRCLVFSTVLYGVATYGGC